MLCRKGLAKGPTRSWDMHPPTLLLFAVFLPTVWLMDLKALDEFVNLPDPHYNYTFLSRKELVLAFIGVNIDNLKMTSQKWLDKSKVDKVIWSHKLEIAVPKYQRYRIPIAKSCLLMIATGQNDEFIPSDLFTVTALEHTAVGAKSVVAVLRGALFQPLTFFNHPLGLKNITGYDIVAYTLWEFINDPTAPAHWLVLFPMVKAAVRAMDTITDYMKKKYRKDVTKFTLTGVGLGGWISWLTAAVDKRVEAIAPVAMDFLNFRESFKHHYRAYCGWSYMMRPFFVMNITQELDNPRFHEMASHLDPWEYNERYANVTKYIIILSGDEFFPPDNSQYYFSQLEGTKHILIMPNTDYLNLRKKQFMERIASFYYTMVEKKYKPLEISWDMKMTNTSATISLTTYNVYRVHSYHADTVGSTRRDFRMKIATGNSSQDNPVKWIRTELREVERNVYTKEMPFPAKGWRRFFIEVMYPSDRLGSFMETTEMLTMPDTLPCPNCYGDGCRGTLV